MTSPWLIQGDFNAILSNVDRVGGILVNHEVAEEFQDCLLSLGLLEMQ